MNNSISIVSVSGYFNKLGIDRLIPSKNYIQVKTTECKTKY